MTRFLVVSNGIKNKFNILFEKDKWRVRIRHVLVWSCLCIPLTKALQWSRTPKKNYINLEKAKFQIISICKKIKLDIKERVNGQIYMSNDCLGCVVL
jgi:hypothetical protein